jgi:GntR family transcriptional regulator, transcriptional repressor for pyruvate dehydrogenase complex
MAVDKILQRSVTLPRVRKLGRKRLSVVVAEQLKEMIFSGEVQPGDKMPNEAALCEHFGVSRITIREAVQMLLALGLVESTRGRGTFVREPDPESRLRDLSYFAFDRAGPVNDLIEVRMLLESQAARTAAAHEKAAERATLGRVVEQAGLLIPGETGTLDTKAIAKIDTQFHVGVAALGGNLVLEQLMLRLMQILEVVRTRTLAIPGQALRSWNEHNAIAEAIAAGDGDAAVERMAEHMESVRRAILDGDAGRAASRKAAHIKIVPRPRR